VSSWVRGRGPVYGYFNRVEQTQGTTPTFATGSANSGRCGINGQCGVDPVSRLGLSRGHGVGRRCAVRVCLIRSFNGCVLALGSRFGKILIYLVDDGIRAGPGRPCRAVRVACGAGGSVTVPGRVPEGSSRLV
jgi:hypothetical protein